MEYADLHLHSVFSDGTYTLEELIAQSKKAGLSAIALVDHDTVEGVGPAQEIGRREGVEVIAGIEFSAEYEGVEIHVLGYCIDHTQAALVERLRSMQQVRVERVHKIVERLSQFAGVTLNAKAVFDLAGAGTVGRLHIARAMVKEGLVSNTAEAFHRYIGDRCPAYIAGFRLDPQEAIRVIRQAGGVPVLAHPYSLGKDELIPVLVEQGLMGLEVYYPEHTQATVNFYLRLCEKYSLLATGGSDCHGEAKSEIRIGSLKIPYGLVEKLKEASARLR